MTTLPPALLEQLLGELSTLASVYHKLPESFVGKGRFGADAIQRAAIQEQRQIAAEDPIAASVAAAANGTTAPQNNIENLLDIDFDGSAPASQSSATGTPDRGGTPAGGAMADMMSMFDAPAAPAAPAEQSAASGSGMGDLMNGFDGLNFGGESMQPTPAAPAAPSQPQQQSSGSNDLLDLL